MINDTQQNYIDELLEVNEEQITNVIDNGVSFIGNILIENGSALLVSGFISGSIESNGPVIVNSNSHIKGSIKAKSLQVSGIIERITERDSIVVDGPVVLSKTAIVRCDVYSDGFKAAHGSIIHGLLQAIDYTDTNNS